MNQLTSRGRRMLAVGIGGAAIALSIGGVAYAAVDDPAPEPGYVVVEDAPGTDGTARADCPEKSGGQNEGQGSQQTPQSTDPQGQA
jgi:hypothetical protein